LVDSAKPPLVCIAGPTATGKTDVAVCLARELGGELIGADSVQVYKHFDIGSAKPTAAQLQGVPHHLLDVIEPHESMDAMQYAARADRAIAEVRARGRVPIVVGGTGLWIRALLRGLVQLPPPSVEVRARLQEQGARLGAHGLHARLRAVDPRSAHRIHPNDMLRIVRALEVYEQTGRPLGELQAEHKLGESRYVVYFAVVDLPKPVLRARITERVEQMWALGLRDEVGSLMQRYGAGIRPLGSVGYAQVRDYLLAESVKCDERDVRAQIVNATWGYTLRQRTWFRSEPEVTEWSTPEQWVRPESVARVRRFWERAA
jgi:tRNA dimethylallyltransferase